MWTITYYSERIQRDILNLPSGLLARYLHYADLWVEFGPNLGMPHSRAMGDGLFELRLKSKEGIGRVFYCTVVAQRIIVLHAFIKKSQKTPKKELDTARRRMREVKGES